jgi:hypothetical protein
VPDPATDLELAHVAGWLHWFRYLALDPSDDQQDLAAALALFMPVYQARPGAIPEQVRAYFDRNRRSSPNDPQVMASRAATFLQETLRTGDRAASNTAIDLIRQALAAAPADHPHRAGWLSNLGLALYIRFSRTGNQADLDEAVEVSRVAAIASPAQDPARVMYLINLGLALRTRFERTRNQTDLDEAIATGRAAVAAGPPGHPDRATWLSNLGAALRARFERSGNQTDLDEAVAADRAAAAAGPPDHLAMQSTIGRGHCCIKRSA